MSASSTPMLMVGGGMTLLVLLLAASSTASAAMKAPDDDLVAGDWRIKVVRSISKHEGQPWSVQRNLDGNGVSWGILQWTQLGGGLGRILADLAQRLPEPMAAAFGGSATLARLVAFTATKSLAPLDGAVLWESPWLERFVAAGRDQAIARGQWEAAISSDYIRAIPGIAASLRLRSERSFALIGNRTVHQGVHGTERAAQRLVAHYNAQGWPEDELSRLVQFAWLCASAFRTEGAAPSGSRLTWRAVEQESDLSPNGALLSVPRKALHAFAGKWDLYELIIRRSAEILADPQWSDEPARELVA